MVTLTAAELAAWARRLEGKFERPEQADIDQHEVPHWLSRTMIQLSGIAGMHQLSNMGVVDAVNPETFESALVRSSLDSVLLFGTLQTPHLLTFEERAPGEDGIVIIGVSGQGGQRLRTAATTSTMSVGRVGFMSNLAPSIIDHIGINQTTGIVVPLSVIRPYEDLLATGVGLFPDTPLTRMTGTAFTRLLVELLQAEEVSQEVLDVTRATVLALVRGLLQQLEVAPARQDRSTLMRADADRVIEEHHRDAAFTIDDLARQVHVSRRQLYRYFGTGDGSVAATLVRRRVATARDLLLVQPPLDLESVASASGFGDASSLPAAFRRYVGSSPSEYRQINRSRSVALARAMLLSDEQAVGH